MSSNHLSVWHKDKLVLECHAIYQKRWHCQNMRSPSLDISCPSSLIIYEHPCMFCITGICITVWLSGNYLNSILEGQSPAIFLFVYSDISVRITWESMRGKVEEEKILVNHKPTCYNKSVNYFANQSTTLHCFSLSKFLCISLGMGSPLLCLAAQGMQPKMEREQELNWCVLLHFSSLSSMLYIDFPFYICPTT